MVLHAAASLLSAVMPAGALGFVTDHPRFESAAARLGVRADSPLAVLLATALLAFPAAVALAASRARGRRERLRANDDEIKVVLVTGASGGLGALIVRRLRKAFPNAAVYGTSRSGVEPVEAIARTDGNLPPLLKLDITNEASASSVIDCIETKHGRLDMLVNNAGSVVATHASATSEEDAHDQFATNFFGAVRMVRLATKLMRAGRARTTVANGGRTCAGNVVAGRIVTVGSIGGRIGLPFQSMYSASKAATMAWTDALRMELRGEKIFASLIEPGDLKPGMVNARKAEGFDEDPIAKRATDIMRAEEAVGTDPEAVAAVVERVARSAAPKGRYLVGPDAWLVEALGRLVPHAWQEYFLASHYRVPPRENAWIRV